MYEKVNPMHPDKIADRIAGAIVDKCYENDNFPKVSVEVLIGHGECNIIMESNINLNYDDVVKIVKRISGENNIAVNFKQYEQDVILSENQEIEPACGDNGIFVGLPLVKEEKILTSFVRNVYDKINKDGKYIIDEKTKYITVCQSNASDKEIAEISDNLKDLKKYVLFINPLGYWTGGLNVDTGATNRKLGSDMGRAVSGGGLHGKDLSKPDVTLNIYAHIMAEKTKKPYEIYCSIGDTEIDGHKYSELIEEARKYINYIGGFEKFAEYGLIR